MSFKINPLYLTDGYKVGHKVMLAPGTTKLYGTWIPRSIKYAPSGVEKIVSFGQQLTWKFIHDVFEEHFFYAKERSHNLKYEMGGGLQVSNLHNLEKLKQDALQFSKDLTLYLGMEYDGKHFEELWDLGYLPIKVKALPEGIETNPNIPHMTFVNTVDGFAWLTLFLETVVSSLAWKPSTSATIARLYRKQAEYWVNKTDKVNMWLVDYLCHDFSARGLSPWDMFASGLGHATSFRGSDTLAVIPAARYYYNEPADEVCINSVNASEHSVSTTKIFTVGEQQMIADWLKIFPKGILSVVSDTFDLWKLITEYLPNLKEAILSRDGKLVIRPDSGNPVDIICGKSDGVHRFNSKEELYDFLSYCEENEGDIIEWESKYYQIEGVEDFIREYGEDQWYQSISINKPFYDLVDGGRVGILIPVNPPEMNESVRKGVIELLWDIFGGTVNEQGYKVLDPHIGAIYGDSITPERQRQIYERLAAKGFAATNIVLGVGSFTYQFNTRDTLGWAAKGAWFEVKETTNWGDGNTSTEITTFNIFKDPVTDDGGKKSLKGLVRVVEDSNGEYIVEQECSEHEENTGILQTIYLDG